MSEREEALWRILVLIVSGIILSLWTNLMQFIIFIHWVYVLISGKRIKDLSEFNNTWVSVTEALNQFQPMIAPTIA